MAQIIKEIVADVSRKNLFQAIVAKQHDSNSRFLQVTLTDEGKNIAIDTASVVTINASRADKESSSFAGTVNQDGTITVPLTKWMLELDDTVKCDISIVSADGSKLTSMSFELEVETAACADGEIEDDENYDLLVTLLANVADVTGACQTAMDSANTAAQSAEAAANTANAAAQNANDTASHLPIISENGYWMLWDTSKGEYVESSYHASVTSVHVGDEPPADPTIDVWVDTSGD